MEPILAVNVEKLDDKEKWNKPFVALEASALDKWALELKNGERIQGNKLRLSNDDYKGSIEENGEKRSFELEDLKIIEWLGQ